jgi:competence protein ComFC
VAIGEPGCRRCGAPGAWPVERCAECRGRRLAFVSARAALAYDASARALVSAWKEGGRRDVSRFAAERIVQAMPAPRASAVVPVPGDRDRTLTRGHVTSRLLARELAGLWGMPFADLLARAGRSERQRGLRAVDRRANVRGAFRAEDAVPRHVCLVDDIYTTGSTASACATTLRAGGARIVWVVTLARVLR